MNLSKNFILAEFTRSERAKQLGIENKPTVEHIENMKSLCLNILQPLRDAFGLPLTVTSGYRGFDYGASNSQHKKGEAVDFVCSAKRDAFNYIKDSLVYDQLIWEFGDNKEPQWIHVSYKRVGVNRGEILRAKKNSKGVTYYEKY